MKRNDVKIGKIVYAWKSLWGEYLIEITEITNDRPARVLGNVIKRLSKGYGRRADILPKTINVGIISIKEPTQEQLECAGV